MVPLIPQRSNADLSSGTAEFKNVCRQLQCTARLHPRSTEVHGLCQGSTSGDRTICHRTSSLHWWYSALWRLTYRIRRSLNLEYAALHWRFTYLVLIDVFNCYWIQRSPRSSDSGPVPVWNVYSKQSSDYMSVQSRSSLPVAYVTSVCCLTANWQCGNTSANS